MSPHRGAPAPSAAPDSALIERVAERLYCYLAERGFILERVAAWDIQTEAYKDNYRSDARWLLREDET